MKTARSNVGDPSNAIPAHELAPPKEQELLVIVGPTASGKTDLSIELAERFNGEIIGADSIQIYRHFNLGSGKPTPTERSRAAHHLVDRFDPLESVDAAVFSSLADEAIEAIRGRGRVPIISGGTFLWIKALVQGLAPAAPADPAVRARHRELVEAMGRQALHARLAEVDPVAAERLAPNDTLRVSRALEVFELSGKPMSAWHAEHGFREARYAYRLIGAAQSQADLDARIEARVRAWLAMGWLDEVRDLIERGYGDARAMGSVGYKEVRAHLAGRLPYGELAATIVRSTRVFARRQRTWLRDEPVVWTSR